MNRKAGPAGASLGAAAAFILDPIGSPFRAGKVSDVRLIERVRAKLGASRLTRGRSTCSPTMARSPCAGP